MLPQIINKYKKSCDTSLNTISDDLESDRKFSIPKNLHRKMKTLSTA